MTPAIVRDAIRSDYRLADSGGAFYRPDPTPALSDAEFRDLCRRVREIDRRAAGEKPLPREHCPRGTCSRDGCDGLVYGHGQRYCSPTCSGLVGADRRRARRAEADARQAEASVRRCVCGAVIVRRSGERATHFRERQSCNAVCARVARRQTVRDRIAAGEWGPARRGPRKRSEATS